MRTVDALGNVHYDDNQVILKGPAPSNLNTKDTNVWQGDYQMVGRQGRGTADLMKQRGENRYTILENGSFTSCLPGSDTWSVVGSEVIHDREEQVAGSGTPASSSVPYRFFIVPTCSCRWATSVVRAS
ncbi:LptA/OstA family protein [Escherichia coli]